MVTKIEPSSPRRARSGPLVSNESLAGGVERVQREVAQRVVRARRSGERLLVDALAREPEHAIERDAGEREPARARSASSDAPSTAGPQRRNAASSASALPCAREDQVADLARRARAAGQARAPVRPLAHPRRARWRPRPRVRRAASRRGRAGRRRCRRPASGSSLSACSSCSQAGELVVLALVDMGDAEFGHALGDDRADAAR